MATQMSRHETTYMAAIESVVAFVLVDARRSQSHRLIPPLTVAEEAPVRVHTGQIELKSVQPHVVIVSKTFALHHDRRNHGDVIKVRTEELQVCRLASHSSMFLHSTPSPEYPRLHEQE